MEIYWNTAFLNNYIYKFAPDGALLARYNHGGYFAQGCAVDKNDHVWVAHSQLNNTVGHLTNEGVFVGNVVVGNGPTGVAVDAAGKIWATNFSSRTVSRIDPNAGPIGLDGITRVGQVDFTTVDLGGQLYNYSDMTGSMLGSAPSKGSWSVVYDSGLPNAQWGIVRWFASIPEDGTLTVAAASSEDGVHFGAEQEVVNGQDLNLPDGRYLKVTVSFRRASNGESPILYELTVATEGYVPQPTPIHPPTTTPTPTSTPALPPPDPCLTWNLGQDFRIAPDQENPNRDQCGRPAIWHFMTSASLALEPQEFTLLPSYSASYKGWVNEPFDGVFIGEGFTNGKRLVIANPSSTRMPVIGWQSPVKGTIAIVGGLEDKAPRWGEGIQWYLYKNTTKLASGVIWGGAQAFGQGEGGEQLTRIPVDVGDMIYVIIHPRSDAESDQTGVNLFIHAVDGSTPTPSETATPGPSPTPTQTATPTSTPTATPTPTPTLPPVDSLVVPGWIGSPANQSTVSGLVPITLAEGVTLTDGVIAYWPAHDRSAVTYLASGLHGTGGDVLATLDTTTLANGSYIIMLSGTDTSGNQVNSGVLITVQGEYKPGRVRFTLTDLTVPLVGLPITVGRTYDSLERNQVGDFGYGWSLAIGNPRLEQDAAHNVTLTMPDGKRVTFYFKPQSAGGIFGFLFYPRYLPEAGLYGSLTSNGCGLLVISGGQYYCFPGGYYAPTEFTYTDPYGRKFVMSADGTLKSIPDLNDNVLTFSPDGITSSAGVSVTFRRDSQGRITQITDPAGNVYQYGYDTNGDLVSVSLPGVANPITYSYENHYFTEAVDPRGNPIIVDAYYPDGRLETESDALGNTWHYAYDLTTRTTTVTNPDGGTIVSRYDDYGMLLGRTDPLGHTTTYAYDANHNLISRTDPLGHTTTYTYDANGNQTSLTNPLGKTSYTTYNQYGGPTSKTDFLGNTQTILYDSRFRPISIRDALGTLAAFTWDERGNVLTRADGNGKVTSFTYDSYGNLLSQTDPLGHTTTFTYDNLGRQISATDARGNTTLFEYDALGRVTRVIEPLGKITRHEYDANGNRTAVVDPRGARTTYDYDAANRLVAVHHPDGTSEQYTYDWRGNVLTHTDPAGHVTRYEYDLAGRLTRVTYAYGTLDSATVQYEYDAAGRKVRQIDPLGRITTYTYDNADHLLEIAAPLGHITRYAYDDNGRRISMTDAGNHTTQYAYDVRGRLIRTTFADGTTIQQVYDGSGNLSSRTDQGGKTTHYGYDDANRLTSVTDPLGHLTAYTYDENSNLLTVTDANGHVTTFEYDVLNRQIRKTWPDGSFETFTYDLNDNLTAHRLADGNTNTSTYDALNCLTRIDYFDGQTVTFTYTPDGLRQTVTDGRGLTRYEYDARERLIAVHGPSSTIRYTYDLVGNRTSMTTPIGAITYAYDDADQLVQVTDPQGRVATFAYNALGLRTEETLPNGVTGHYAYDALGRLTSIDYSSGDSFHYTLDPAGNRLREESTVNGQTSTVEYTYDALYRLTTVRSPSSTVQFTYDAAGNRLSQATTVNGQTSTIHYAYDILDRLTSVSGPSSTVQFTYDARGNLTTARSPSSTVTYTWDAADRLTAVNGPSSAVQFTYDADGRRVQQTATVNGLPSTVHYLWDEASPYGDVVLETSGSSSTSYLLAGAQLLAQDRDGIIRYYLRDGQGSTRTLTDSRGNITDSYAYTAFGELLSQSGATPNAYLYTGQQYDAATGLYYLRARYYAPGLGRFLSPDAYPYVLANPIELNRYVYAANNPVNASDPAGLSALNEYLQLIRKKVQEVQVFFHAGTEWHIGLETIEHMNIFHIGRSLKYGIHIAFGAVKPMVADWHLYVYPATYLWRPSWGDLIYRLLPPGWDILIK